jgi:hypothetical protein
MSWVIYYEYHKIDIWLAHVKRRGHTMTTTPQVGKPVKRGAGWWVPSGQVGYHVERVDGRWRCTCPSFRWRKQQLCKHVRKVLEMKEVAY